MKKTLAILGLGVYIMSASAMTVQGTVAASSAPSPASNADKWICASNAVDKRDTAIMGAVDANSQAIKAALTNRKDSLKALYTAGKADGKKDERKAVWSAFSSSTRSAMGDMRNARRAAWDTFQKEMVSCGIKSSNEKMETVVTPIAY